MSDPLAQVIELGRRGSELFAAAHAAAVEQDAEERLAAMAAEPFALSLDAFIERKAPTRPALLGTTKDNYLPAGGLAILGGKAGVGKSTLAIDLAFHLAAGRSWLGIPVSRPLTVLIVENEGPREPFREKLAEKRQAWRERLPGAISVYTGNWGGFTLADGETRSALRCYLEAMSVDVVIGDPLDSLGVEGVGSPSETRAFIDMLKTVGLVDDVAFVFLHHLAVTRSGSDEIDELRGAWAGHTDLLMSLKEYEGDRARLSFPKTKWARRPDPLILRRDRDTASFSVVAEGVSERDLAAELAALLADGAWRTVSKIAAPKEKGGIGANRSNVEETLRQLAAAGRVEYQQGPPGQPRDAKCWRVAQGGSSNPEQPPLAQGLLASPSPYKGEGEQPPLAQGAEQPRPSEPVR